MIPSLSTSTASVLHTVEPQLAPDSAITQMPSSDASSLLETQRIFNLFGIAVTAAPVSTATGPASSEPTLVTLESITPRSSTESSTFASIWGSTASTPMPAAGGSGAVFPPTSFSEAVHILPNDTVEAGKFISIWGTSALPSPTVPSSFKTLIDSYSRFWNAESQRFNRIPFYKESFEALCAANNTSFPKAFNPEIEYGALAIKTVDKGTKIFVRADLHGDLKSLIENIQELQRQGLLDESFRCREGVQLIFLGDYVDRGEHCVQVLELLLTLRRENPLNVTLIRGNHEDVEINSAYGAADANFIGLIADERGRQMLESVYDTFNLALFMGERSDSFQVQYTMFTHGLFELYADPKDILLAQPEYATMAVPKGRLLELRSERVRALLSTTSSTDAAEYSRRLSTSEKAEHKSIKQEWAAARVSQLIVTEMFHDVTPSIFSSPDSTAFNWGDMQKEGLASHLGNKSERLWKLNAEDVKHYLRFISAAFPDSTGRSSKVKLVFRGHEHQMQHHSYKGKVVVTTLPVAMDSVYKKDFFGAFDTAYIITTAPKVKDWQKRAMLRMPGFSMVEITAPHPLTSASV